MGWIKNENIIVATIKNIMVRKYLNINVIKLMIMKSIFLIGSQNFKMVLIGSWIFRMVLIGSQIFRNT